MNRELYNFLRARGIGAKLAFQISKMMVNSKFDSSWESLASLCYRPFESPSEKELVRIRRADDAYCYEHDC